MAGRSRHDVVQAVLRRFPRTYAERLGLRSLETPSARLRLLLMALLMSARIRASIALDAATLLLDR